MVKKRALNTGLQMQNYLFTLSAGGAGLGMSSMDKQAALSPLFSGSEEKNGKKHTRE